MRKQKQYMNSNLPDKRINDRSPDNTPSPNEIDWSPFSRVTTSFKTRKLSWLKKIYFIKI
jgi:hypothetical protein